MQVRGGGGADARAAARNQRMPALQPIVLGHAFPFKEALAQGFGSGKARKILNRETDS
jgi:hypothetical protein